MSSLLTEIESNYDMFSQTWRAELLTVNKDLDHHRARFLKSYVRLVSLNAWRSDLLASKISPDSLAFFLEAQNDGLVSHVLAALGSWRSALKSLRSSIENIYQCLYYKDHPVELELWHVGKHRLGFSELNSYLLKHPKFIGVPTTLSGTELIQQEYATLSRAVHGSATFRMTQRGTGTNLWSSATAKVGAWETRHAKTLCGINLLLLTIFRDNLQGAALSGLRTAVGLSIPSSMHSQIKVKLKVTLPQP